MRPPHSLIVATGVPLPNALRWRLVSNWPQEEYTIIVDALFGIGLSRQIQGEYADIVKELNRRPGYKLSVDVPSGVHAESGKIMGEAVRADVTGRRSCAPCGGAVIPLYRICGTRR